MSTLIPKNRPWWKEPMVWMVITLPAIAVIASFTSYYFAAHGADPLVKEDYRNEGMAPLAPVNPASQAAAAMGLTARLSLRNGQLELDLGGHLAALPGRLALSILHPTRENQDLHIILAQSHGQTYVGPAPDMGSGKRSLILEPVDQAWRITGVWTAPFAGMTELSAGSTHPATHP